MQTAADEVGRQMPVKLDLARALPGALADIEETSKWLLSAGSRSVMYK
jgi:hypothetical protein